MGENIRIDGMDVSGLRREEALALLEGAQKERLADLYYGVDLEGSAKLFLSGQDMGIRFNTEDVLDEALSLYSYALKPRELFTKPRVGIEQLRVKLMALLAPYDRPYRDAKAVLEEDGFVYVAAEEGIQTDVQDLAGRLSAAVEAGTGSLALKARREILLPKYSLEEAKRDTELLSEFSTSFAASAYRKAGRVFNIEKAAACIDGLCLAPGEIFDMNRILGDRNEANGWQLAAGIRYGVYVEEYGGGVCQVSSTLYNAVLMADLEVLERQHHSWPLGYIDIGRDATISTGGPNFCFRNDSQTPIYIQARVDKGKKKISVRLYGRAPEDGSQIRIKSKKVETLPAAKEEVILDRTLPPGTEVVEREARIGSVSETYKLYYDGEGKFLRQELVTRDRYRSIGGIRRLSADLYEAYQKK